MSGRKQDPVCPRPGCGIHHIPGSLAEKQCQQMMAGKWNSQRATEDSEAIYDHMSDFSSQSNDDYGDMTEEEIAETRKEIMEDFVYEADLQNEVSSLKALKYVTEAYGDSDEAAEHALTGIEDSMIDGETPQDAAVYYVKDRLRDSCIRDYLSLNTVKMAKLMANPEFRQDFFQGASESDKSIINITGVRASVANMQSIIDEHDVEGFVYQFESYGDGVKDKIVKSHLGKRDPEEIRRSIKEEAMQQAYEIVSDTFNDNTEYGEDVIKESLRNSDFSKHVDRVLDERMKEYPDPNGPDAHKSLDWGVVTADKVFDAQTLASSVKNADINPETYLEKGVKDHEINDRNMELMGRRAEHFVDNSRKYGHVFGSSQEGSNSFIRVVDRRIMDETKKELDSVEDSIRSCSFDTTDYYSW